MPLLMTDADGAVAMTQTSADFHEAPPSQSVKELTTSSLTKFPTEAVF
jgi:hypothetical protein